MNLCISSGNLLLAGWDGSPDLRRFILNITLIPQLNSINWSRADWLRPSFTCVTARPRPNPSYFFSAGLDYFLACSSSKINSAPGYLADRTLSICLICAGVPAFRPSFTILRYLVKSIGLVAIISCECKSNVCWTVLKG